MAKDEAPIAKIVIERDLHHTMFLDRWRWYVFIDPPKLERLNRPAVSVWADYVGSACTQKRAHKKAMKLIPRYVRVSIC